jgi:hypothetical protein
VRRMVRCNYCVEPEYFEWTTHTYLCSTLTTMGTYSFFEGSTGDCEVDWDAMDTEKLFLFCAFELVYKKVKMCSEVGALMKEVKLFTYMDQGLFDAFHEFNRHLVPNGQRPVWVFSFEGDDKTKGLRFYPGEDKMECFSGSWMPKKALVLTPSGWREAGRVPN